MAASLTAFAENPFVTSIYTADPSAHVWADGRLYVYPSRDIDPPKGCDLMDHYHVFSTDNLVDWRDEGEILNSSQVAWGRKEGGFMWAPDAAFKDGTYYFYFPHPSDTKWNESWKIGVATSTKPASDFTATGYLEGTGGHAMIDPAVFIDTDGQAYLYYGGGAHCAGVKLKPNMTEIDGPVQEMTGLTDFHEATWVFKRNGIYYLTYADNFPKTNKMEYAISSSPLGPWTSKGVYIDSTGCDTMHGSVVEYKGQWYQFYHNKAISDRGNLRSICVDKLNFNEDGTIQMMEQTKSGPPAVGPAAPDQAGTPYEAASAEVGGGATLQDDSAASGGKSVQNLNLPDSFVQWQNVDGGQRGGRATVTLYATVGQLSKLRLVVNDVDDSCVNFLPSGTGASRASLTVPLNAGAANTIKVVGAGGAVPLQRITVAPLPN